MASARSSTATVCPARVSCWAAASPAGPDPMTATVLPVWRSGTCGVTQPSSKARSMIETSTCLMVTASELMPRTHAVSHGAGQSRPVNSGKLFVACSRSAAARPVVAPGQVVPLGDQVAERAAVVAERDAAVHAAARLPVQLVGVLRLVDLVPVHDAYVDRATRGELALRRRQEALRVSHARPP